MLGDKMGSRTKRTRPWQEIHKHVREALELAEKYGLNTANPNQYIAPNENDQIFNDLLKQID